ncbi:MAG TPA: sugar transferase [Streptosporangiaceae bacterium]|nr:sugar transferase [Streptosporangiaceae bacterium]
MRADPVTSRPAQHDHEAATAGGVAYRAVKRGMDIVLGSVMLAASLPVIAVAAAAVVFETPGSPFFLQWRASVGGRPFRIIKLRTMVAKADRLGPVLTQLRDPRITTVGSLLRRWSVDELPQLVNVLAGQMSLVGPRPEVLPIVATYPVRHRGVLSVQPGLTGWAQVHGRDELSIPDKLELEMEYVTSRSIAMDLRILARTVLIVLTGRGVTR